MFAYCNNNPVNYTDPTGHASWGTNTVAICDGGCASVDNPFYWNDPSRPWNTYNAYPTPQTTFKDEIDSFVTSIKNTKLAAYCGKIAKNIRFTAGRGYGLYGEITILNIECEAGFYANEIVVEIQNGQKTYYYDYFLGVNAGLLFDEIGGQYHKIMDGSSAIDDSWFLVNTDQTSISLFGIAVYTPWGGGMFDISLDLEGLKRDFGIFQ